MRRLITLACLAALLSLPACGGDSKKALGCCRSGPRGGGGGDAAGDVVTVLREGDSEPAPNTGTFGPIPVKPLMDVSVHEEDDPGYADNPFPGVYCCFVVPVLSGVDQVPLDVLYVRQPDGVLVRVIGVGESLPGTGGGVLAGFHCVWMCPEGNAIFACDISGSAGEATFGVFARQVFGGGVGDVTKLMIEAETLNGMSSEITRIDYESGIITQPAGISFLCRFYVLVENLIGQSVLYAVNADGSAPFPVLSPITTVVQGLPVLRVDAFGVSNDGLLLAAAVQLDRELGVDPAAIVSTRTLDLKFDYKVVALEGDEFDTGLPPPADTGFAGAIYTRGPILVTSDGAIVWLAAAAPPPIPLPPGIPNDLVLLGQEEGNALKSLVSSGTPAVPGTAGGSFGTIDIVRSRVSVTNGRWPVFFARILGDPAVTQALYAVDRPAPADPATYVEVALEGDAAGGGMLEPAFALSSFEVGKRRDSVRRTSDTVFVDALTGGDAPSGLFRVRPAGTILSIALEGDAIPNQGVRYGPITAYTTTQGAVLFRAVILSASSGLFLETYSG